MWKKAICLEQINKLKKEIEALKISLLGVFSGNRRVHIFNMEENGGQEDQCCSVRKNYSRNIDEC
jgi:hypothetical protein